MSVNRRGFIGGILGLAAWTAGLLAFPGGKLQSKSRLCHDNRLLLNFMRFKLLETPMCEIIMLRMNTEVQVAWVADPFEEALTIQAGPFKGKPNPFHHVSFQMGYLFWPIEETCNDQMRLEGRSLDLISYSDLVDFRSLEKARFECLRSFIWMNTGKVDARYGYSFLSEAVGFNCYSGTVRDHRAEVGRPSVSRVDPRLCLGRHSARPMSVLSQLTQRG